MNQQKEFHAELERSTATLLEAIRSIGDQSPDAGQLDHASTQEQDSTEVPEPEPQLGTKRGTDTMLRSAYRVQMELTALADNKANMMISINAIIISIIIAAVAPKLDKNLWILFPTIVILMGTLASVVYAILAARPRLHSKSVELNDLEHSRGNILFFGNFARMDPREFLTGMEEIIGNQTLTYETMIRNIYDLGFVLNRKYALLQTAYSIFMIALVLGVFSFIAMFVWITQNVG